MTQAEILEKELSGESYEDDEIDILLDRAKMIILNRRYPFQSYPKDDDGNFLLEDRYLNLQIRIAVELFNKRGVEGQTSHTENAVTRNYGSAGVSGALLNEIVPKAGVIGYEESEN